MLNWDERYELGHPRIDAEHRIFLGLINDFQEAVSRNLPKDKLTRILQEIVKYADFHFVSEENIMADCNYPELGQHAGLHRLLLEDARNYFTRFKSGEIEANEVFEFIFQWFAFHTSREDKKLVGFIQNSVNGL